MCSSYFQGCSTLRLQADRLSEQLMAEVEARKDAEEHARLLELSLESSGKGMALLKAAKYEAELEKAHQYITDLEKQICEKAQVRQIYVQKGFGLSTAPNEQIRRL